MAYGTIPKYPTQVGASGSSPYGSRPRGELDQKIVELLGKGNEQSLPTETPAVQQSPGGGVDQPRSMDWRLRAAEMMRRQMINKSESESQPAWMRQR